MGRKNNRTTISDITRQSIEPLITVEVESEIMNRKHVHFDSIKKTQPLLYKFYLCS